MVVLELMRITVHRKSAAEVLKESAVKVLMTAHQGSPTLVSISKPTIGRKDQILGMSRQQTFRMF